MWKHTFKNYIKTIDYHELSIGIYIRTEDRDIH